MHSAREREITKKIATKRKKNAGESRKDPQSSVQGDRVQRAGEAAEPARHPRRAPAQGGCPPRNTLHVKRKEK